MTEAAIVDVEDDDELYRRLAPNHVNADGSVNSVAFMHNWQPADRLSVDLARLTTPKDSLDRAGGREGFKLGVLSATSPRSLGFAVTHDPTPENHSHSVIAGANDKEKCRRLALATVVLAVPNDATLTR